MSWCGKFFIGYLCQSLAVNFLSMFCCECSAIIAENRQWFFLLDIFGIFKSAIYDQRDASYHFLWCFGAVIMLLTSLSTFIFSRYQCVPLLKMDVRWVKHYVLTKTYRNLSDPDVRELSYCGVRIHRGLDLPSHAQYLCDASTQVYRGKNFCFFSQTETICQRVNISGIIWRRWWLGNYTIAR